MKEVVSVVVEEAIVKKEKKSEDKDTYNAALEAIKAMKAKAAEKTMQKEIFFAGQKHQVETIRTLGDAKRELAAEKQKLGGACSGLDALVS